MGIENKGKENESVSVGAVNKDKLKSSASGLSSLQSKSLIPVPVTSPPKGDEENSAPVAEGLKIRRRPLGAITNDSPRPSKVSDKKVATLASANVKVVEPSPSKNAIVGRKSKSIAGKAVTDAGTVTPLGKSRLSTGVPNTPANSPSKLKSKKNSSGVGGVKNNEKEAEVATSIAYWKELAESRRQALEEALQENMELHERMQELKLKNEELEELVEEAKKLANMVNEATEDIDLDESGIGDTVDVIV